MPAGYCYQRLSVGIEVASPSFLLRFYYLSGPFGASLPGGKLQLIYYLNPFLKLYLSISCDQLLGIGAVGDNGTRIVRLIGSDSTYEHK